MSLIFTTQTSGTTFQNTAGLNPGTTYCYAVSAVNNAGEGSKSSTASATTTSTPPPPPPPPGAPSGLTASTISESQINLAWNTPSGSPTNYKIYRGTSCGSLSLIFTTQTSGTTFQNTAGLSAGTTYCYAVSAVNGAGEGTKSSTASATTTSPTPNLPGAPSGLTASTISESQINLAWNTPSGSVTDYKIYRGTTSGSLSLIYTTGMTGTTFQNTAGLSPCTTYYYAVSAVNSAGEGPRSSQASATTTGCQTPDPVPGSPTSLTATTVSESQINLAWNAPSGSPTNYKIYRGTSCGSLSLIFTTQTSGTTFQNTAGLNPGTTYCYAVSAVNGAGEGLKSSTASATTTTTPTPLPGAPSDLSAQSISATQIDLSWNSASGTVTNYKVYRGTSSGGESLAFTSQTTTPQWQNVAGLSCNTRYYYQVSWVNSAGEGPRSSEVYATTSACQSSTAPGAPLNLRVTSTTSSHVYISWNAPSSNGGSSVTDYRIYRGTSSGAESYYNHIGGTATDFDNTGSQVQCGTTYWYKVTAVNSIDESTYSNGVSGTTASCGSSKLATPGNPLPGSTSGSGPELSLTPRFTWNSVANADNYHVEVYDTDSGAYVAQGDYIRTLYFDVPAGKLLAGHNYEWHVKAFPASGSSYTTSDFTTPLNFHTASSQQPPTAAPVLSTVSCNSCVADSQLHTVTLTGSGFVSTDTLTFTAPGGATYWRPERFHFVSSSQITYDINPDTASGTWYVRVNALDGQQSATKGFTVSQQPAPGQTLPPSPSAETPAAACSGRSADLPAKFGSRKSGVEVDSIVLHAFVLRGEPGEFDAVVQDLKCGPNATSAHYAISQGGEIRAIVGEEYRAHHATYYNSRSIGIEIEGAADDPTWWTWNDHQAMYTALARLVQDIQNRHPSIALVHPDVVALQWEASGTGDAASHGYSKDYSVCVTDPVSAGCGHYHSPFNQAGIVSHHQIQPNQKSDPGPNFEWIRFMTLVKGENVPAPSPASLPSSSSARTQPTIPAFWSAGGPFTLLHGPQTYTAIQVRREGGVADHGWLFWTETGTPVTDRETISALVRAAYGRDIFLRGAELQMDTLSPKVGVWWPTNELQMMEFQDRLVETSVEAAKLSTTGLIGCAKGAAVGGIAGCVVIGGLSVAGDVLKNAAMDTLVELNLAANGQINCPAETERVMHRWANDAQVDAAIASTLSRHLVKSTETYTVMWTSYVNAQSSSQAAIYLHDSTQGQRNVEALYGLGRIAADVLSGESVKTVLTLNGLDLVVKLYEAQGMCTQLANAILLKAQIESEMLYNLDAATREGGAATLALTGTDPFKGELLTLRQATRGLAPQLAEAPVGGVVEIVPSPNAQGPTSASLQASDGTLQINVAVKPGGGNELHLRLSSTSHDGKLIIVKAPVDLWTSETRLRVRLDGEEVTQAMGYDDLTADKSVEGVPKYLLVQGPGGNQLLVWVPHFSERTIEVASIRDPGRAFFTPTGIFAMAFGSLAIASTAYGFGRRQGRNRSGQAFPIAAPDFDAFESSGPLSPGLTTTTPMPKALLAWAFVSAIPALVIAAVILTTIDQPVQWTINEVQHLPNPELVIASVLVATPIAFLIAFMVSLGRWKTGQNAVPESAASQQAQEPVLAISDAATQSGGEPGSPAWIDLGPQPDSSTDSSGPPKPRAKRKPRKTKPKAK